MQTFASIWLILGIVIVIAMITLSLFKKIKWKITGVSALIYILGLTILVLTVKPTGDKTTQSSESKATRTVKKHSVKFSIISKKDKDTDDYETNKDGNFNLKIKSLGNGKIYVKDGDPNSDYKNKFKTVTLNVKKGDVKTVPLSLSTDDPTREYTIESSTGYKKHIEVYNFSDAYSASESADESSESASESSDSSTTTEYPHYKSNKKVASAINDDFSNSGVDHLENTHVKYKDPIFYVSVPDDVAISTNNEQKEYYEKIARAIHSYQKQPTGVIYFEDQQGNIVATTKALNNNEVKLK